MTKSKKVVYQDDEYVIFEDGSGGAIMSDEEIEDAEKFDEWFNSLSKEEQDAYILGVDVPVKEFVGKIIAIIHRYDDVEEKWVVVPRNMSYTKEEIKKQVEFQEKYFKSKIIMQKG